MRSMPFDLGKTERWLRDIQYHSALAESFVAGTSDEAFKDDLLRLYAVTRCLEIISEASRRLPDDLKPRHPAIAWRDIAASGNICRHEYEDVAGRRVWDTFAHHLPPLRAVILAELAAFDGTS